MRKLRAKTGLGGDRVKTKKERLLELLQDAEGEEKSQILAKITILDEEVRESA